MKGHVIETIKPQKKQTWLKKEYTDNFDEADFLIFTDNDDVIPMLFGEKSHHTHCRPHIYRDLCNVKNYNDGLAQDKYMIGINYGALFLNAMNGGHVLQYVLAHNFNHTTFLGNGSVITTESSHHQMMNPYNLSDDQYKILGASTDLISDYEDADRKPIELPNDFYEPEIVWFPKTKCLSIQGNPNESTLNGDSLKQIVMIVEGFLNDHLNSYNDIRTTNLNTA